MTSRGAMAAVWAIAGLKFVLHLYANGQYGYFRDEFDYIACGEHLDWGFVDHPPLIPLIAKLSRMLLGDSLRAIRFVPAVASSLIVALGAAIARRFGGGPYAMLLTAGAIAVAPIYLSDGSLLTTNCLEPLLWMGCVSCAMRAVAGEPRWWLAFGAVAGIGLEEKYSIAVLGAGIVGGLLLTRHRHHLASRWMWMGGALALAVFAPNLIWNIRHQWPFLEAMANIKASGRDVALPPLKFLAEQMLLAGPPAAMLWLAGLGALLAWPRLREYRFLGWCYLIAFAFFEITHGKNYYLAPVYPMLLAAGSVACESSRRGWVKALAPLAILPAGLWLIPITVPVIPVERLGAYLDSLPFEIPRSEVSHRSVALPQHYADQFGWVELVDVVEQAWLRLPTDKRAGCAIFGQNYGQAGAVDFLGRMRGLPPAISGHQTYFLWGPRGYSGSCMIVIGDREARLREVFDSVEPAGVTNAPYALEGRIPVFVCRGPRFGSLAKLWPSVKKWG